MRYTKSKKRFDGNQTMFYNPNQQQQSFQPQAQVMIKDSQGHTFQIQKDMSVPDLGLTPKMVNDFKQMEDYYGKAPSDKQQKDLKQLLMLKAIGTNDQYLDSYRDTNKIPNSNNHVWNILCNYYTQNFRMSYIDQRSQFKYWLAGVLSKYATHHYA